MIIAYDRNGKEIGRYDTASDLYYDYPDAEVSGSKAKVKDPSGSFFIFYDGITDQSTTRR